MPKLLAFTDPSGGDVWIAPHWVTKVREPLPGRHHKDARCIITMGNTEVAVSDSVTDVILKLMGEDPSA